MEVIQLKRTVHNICLSFVEVISGTIWDLECIKDRLSSLARIALDFVLDGQVSILLKIYLTDLML